MLIAAQNESELASVLSHEIGHVSQRHIARMIGQQKQDALLPLAALILAALVGKAGGGADAAIGVAMGGQGLAIQRQLNFSRDAEREADRVGFQTMRAAGYDTSGMVAFFKRLQSTTRLYGEAPAWLSSHPLTGERIADIQARIREIRSRAASVRTAWISTWCARARVLQDESQKGGMNAHGLRVAAGRAEYPAPDGRHVRHVLSVAEKGDLKAARVLARQGESVDAAEAGRAVGRASRLDGEALFAQLGIDIKLAPGQPPEMQAQAVRMRSRRTTSSRCRACWRASTPMR
jgi:predicted Zn-dependent protease